MPPSPRSFRDGDEEEEGNNVLKLDLNGLVAAPHTPMYPDGSLHTEVIARQAASLRRDGVIGAFVCGTTGEGVSLTLSERCRVAEVWRRTAEGLKLIVNVSHACLADCQELAAHAAAIGADGVALMAPSFFRPSHLSDLIAFCAQVAAAAPEMPFFYYHMPAMTGVSFKMAEFLPAAAARIPSFAGIKFTSEDLMDYGRCCAAAAGTFDVLFGRDEILLSALALGATGAVGSTYNFAAPLYQGILAAYRSGDYETARRQQARAMEMIAALGRYGGLAAGKAAMAKIGIDCGPVRLPLRNLDDIQRRALAEDLDRLHVVGAMKEEEKAR